MHIKYWGYKQEREHINNMHWKTNIYPQISITIRRFEDILWNNHSYTSAILFKQYISKDIKTANCKTDFFFNLYHTVPIIYLSNLILMNKHVETSKTVLICSTTYHNGLSFSSFSFCVWEPTTDKLFDFSFISIHRSKFKLREYINSK